jgi:exopolysaccharide biosynthesis polyprenyl glycosylphosphotransferase
MMRDHERYFTPLLYFLDSISMALSYVFCLFVYTSTHSPASGFPVIISFPLYPGVTALSLFIAGSLFFSPFLYRYGSDETIPIKRTVLRIALFQFAAVAILVGFMAIDPFYGNKLSFGSLFVIFSCGLLLLNRIAVKSLIRFKQKRGGLIRYLLIAGTDQRALNVAAFLEAHPDRGAKIVGFLTNKPPQIGTQLLNYPVLGSMEDLTAVVKNHIVDGVVATGSPDEIAEINSLAQQCRALGIDFAANAPVITKKTGSITVERFGNVSVILSKPVAWSPEKLFIKRSTDMLLSASLIILFLPLWIVIPIVIKLDSPGPILFCHKRVGRNGRPLDMYKFRSMVVGAEEMQPLLMPLNEMDGPVFKIRNDPRVTGVGRFLRRTSLDEIPQLFNVFAGNMSLVGPRPFTPYETLRLNPRQRKRISVTQGITCLWQVSGRNEIPFDEWIELDLQYIENWSLGLDFSILLSTIKAVVTRKGAQ